MSAAPRHPLIHECTVLLGRLWVGGALAVAGVAGLLAPTAELVRAIEGYQVLPAQAAPYLAQALPWVEAVIGLAVLIGLTQRISLRVAAGLVTLFWLVTGQALLRRLPLSDCGCFGQLLSLSLPRIWLLDGALLLIAWWLVPRHTAMISLDRWAA